MLELESVAMIDEKKEMLKALLPEIFTDGKIDTDALKVLFGEEVESEKEKYRFTWNGKRDLFSLINKRSSGTLKPDITKSLNFDSAQNAIIEGDNLEVLKLLGSAYHRRVKMIYIDPPYNKQKDFVYPDNWSDPLESYLMQTGQKDEFGLTSSYQDKTGRLHTNWLNMIYPRLYLARNLLRDDGVIFVSIDDDEVHNLRKVMDEIFGDENFVGQFIWQRRQNADSRNESNVSVDHEYILCYSKTSTIRFNGKEIDIDKYKNPDNDPRGNWASIDLSGLATRDQRPNLHYDLIDPVTGYVYPPNPQRGWSKSKAVIDQMILEGRILFPSKPTGRPREKKFLNDLQQMTTGFSTYLSSKNVGYTTNGTRVLSELFDGKFFDFPKPVELIQEFIKQSTNADDIILDFFAGSGTTAHAVMAQNAADGGNRRYILVQIPEALPENSEARKLKFETIADITAERVRRAAKNIGDTSGFRYFRLDRSHFRVFDQIKYEKGKSPEEVLKLLRLSMFVDNTMMSGWTKAGAAFETALKNGLGLSSTYTVEKRGEYTLHILEEGGRIFTFCFDDAVKEDIAKFLPTGAKFVCFDKALTDSVKLNIAAQIGTENIETI
jgi:adenine-specific DNA-methyltransferase